MLFELGYFEEIDRWALAVPDEAGGGLRKFKSFDEAMNALGDYPELVYETTQIQFDNYAVEKIQDCLNDIFGSIH